MKCDKTKHPRNSYTRNLHAVVLQFRNISVKLYQARVPFLYDAIIPKISRPGRRLKQNQNANSPASKTHMRI